MFLFLALLIQITGEPGGICKSSDKPDLKCTPGIARQILQPEVCSTKWGLDNRHVTEQMKREIAVRYGINWNDRAKYEFDHLIPRELGGSDDLKNLWPQLKADADKKDQLENRMHKLVCTGELSLHDAREQIVNDWVGAYERYIFKFTPPVPVGK
jgi:hypothetical protein